MAKTKESRLKSQKKYDEAHKDNYKAYYLKCSKVLDKDIIDFLDCQTNKQGIIKEIIRQQIARQST